MLLYEMQRGHFSVTFGVIGGLFLLQGCFKPRFLGKHVTWKRNVGRKGICLPLHKFLGGY